MTLFVKNTIAFQLNLKMHRRFLLETISIYHEKIWTELHSDEHEFQVCPENYLTIFGENTTVFTKKKEIMLTSN